MEFKNNKQPGQDKENGSKNVENCVNSADKSVKVPKSRQQVADEALNNATSRH